VSAQTEAPSVPRSAAAGAPTEVEGLAAADVGTVSAAHYALMQEYVDALIYVRNCLAAGTRPVGGNLVRSHINRRLNELEAAYIYRGQVAPPGDETEWYGSVLSSLRELRGTLPSHSAWRTIKGFTSTTAAIVIFIITVVTSVVTAEKLVELPKLFASAVSAVGGFAGLAFETAPALALGIIYPVIHAYIFGFYDKRRVLLGSDTDLQVVKVVTGRRPRGRNVYELEDKLFGALGLVKERETQRDGQLVWLVISVIWFLWWIPLLFETSSVMWMILAALAVVIVGSTSFLHWRANKRRYA
jgi:hypothetical protein